MPIIANLQFLSVFERKYRKYQIAMRYIWNWLNAKKLAYLNLNI